MLNVLIDAGPLVALFAVADTHHARYDAQVIAAATDGLRLVTTWPCVAEASYILEAPWRFELPWTRIRAI